MAINSFGLKGNTLTGEMMTVDDSTSIEKNLWKQKILKDYNDWKRTSETYTQQTCALLVQKQF